MISIIGEIMLEFIIKRLLSSISCDDDTTCQQQVNWKHQEALIYMLQSVVSELNETTSHDNDNNESSSLNDQYLCQFVQLLPKINYSNKHILSTTLLAIGSLGSWLQRCAPTSSCIMPNCVSLCLLGLRSPQVTQSASFALKDVIMECDLSSYAAEIIETCQQALGTAAPCQAQNYQVRLISIIGICLSDLIQVDLTRALTWLQLIIEPYLLKLNDLSQLSQVVIDKQNLALTCHLINLLTQLMSSLIQRQQHESHSQSHLVVTGGGGGDERRVVNQILVKLIPIYRVILKRNSPADLIVIDKMFESISVNLAACISSESESVLDDQNFRGMEFLLSDLVEMFYMLNENAWKRYAYEVCRQLIVLFYKQDKYKLVLEQLFIYSYENTIKLTQRDLVWFHDHTDVVEQAMTMLAKILKSKYYDLVEKLNMVNLRHLCKFAQLALQLPEVYTLRATSTFVEEFIKFTKTKKLSSRVNH
jgi:hypothetical protein